MAAGAPDIHIPDHFGRKDKKSMTILFRNIFWMLHIAPPLITYWQNFNSNDHIGYQNKKTITKN